MRTLQAFVALALLGAVSPQAGAAEYNRGDEVRVQTAEGQPASPPVQRVMAGPGDRVKIDGKRLSVDEQAISGISPKLLLACGSWAKTVPPGHYFLIGEELVGESATRSCSLLPASRILGGVRR